MQSILNFNETEIEGQKGYEFLYKTPISGIQLFTVINPLYRLGFVSVYEVRLGSEKGMGIGYVFTSGTSEIKMQHNYLLFMRPKIAEANKIKIARKGGKLELKYTLNNLRIFIFDNLVFITRSDVDDSIIRRLNNDV